MPDLSTYISLVWVHFIADFVFQGDKMALNKSTNSWWLLLHSAIYGGAFWWLGWYISILIGVSHYFIDYVTSRGTSALHKAGQRHWFFTLIGFDQAVHLTLLFWLVTK